MKYGVSSYNYRRHQINCFDAAEQAKKTGFDHIEYIDLNETEAGDMCEVARRLHTHCEALGLEIWCYTVQADFLWGSGGDLKAEIERIKAKIDIGEALGVHLMRHDASTGWPEGKEGTFDEAVERIAAACRELTAYAEQKGIRTMVENHGYYCQASERMEKIVTAVNHPNFGLLVDMGNFLCVDETPAEAVRRLIPHAFHLHCKDFHCHPADYPNPGEGYFRSQGNGYIRAAIVGHGDVNVRQCLEIAKSAGYQGRLSLEFEGMEDVETGNRIGLDNMKRFWEEAENG
ncbi:MAG: sugar phosphate isomerase/epimerase [Clostridiales bacterium]|nr:sugar phosphate isomerase/epimerase [Clostridiales bacterium]